MGLKHITLSVLFFSCSFAFSQSDMINSSDINPEINVDYPFTSQELSFIENTFDDNCSRFSYGHMPPNKETNMHRFI